MRWIVVTCCIVLGSVLATGCGGDASETARPDYRVEDLQYTLQPGGARILTGTFVNPTDEPLRNAQVQVSLFDADNQRIASMNIHVRDIPARGTRPFREPVDSDLDVQGARVKSILVL